MTKEGIIGNMLQAPKSSNHGCHLLDRAPCDNWIAIVERGGCSFIDKVRTLQSSGAKAVIIGDRHYNGWITMYAAGKKKRKKFTRALVCLIVIFFL